MIKQTLKTENCNVCGLSQQKFVLENANFTEPFSVDFSLYGAFKSPTFNLCENCKSLSQDYSQISDTVKFDDKSQEIKGLLETFNLNEVYATIFSEKAQNQLLNMRAKAYLFDSLKLEYDKFLSKNYHKIDEKTKETLSNNLTILKARAKELSILCEDYLEKENNPLVKCLFIEMLAFLGETKKAKFLLCQVTTDSHLFDYLSECIDLGGRN